MALRAGIVVSGTEVLTGRVSDRNGPWLAEQLRELGVDVGHIVVAGDRPDDLRAAITFLAGTGDLVITSGGLGPTADDLTAAVVADVQGRPLRLDTELEQRITAIVQRISSRFPGFRDPEATAIATRKQAYVPDGATVLEPTGTAPGLVVPVADGQSGPPVIVLPGPPSELQAMWPAAVQTPAVQALLAGAEELRQATLRLWGVPESELAATLRRHEAELDGLEITTCLAAGELEIVSRYAPAAEPAQQTLLAAVRQDFPDQLFSADGRSVGAIVIDRLRAQGWTVASLEAGTGAAISALLMNLPDADGVVIGATSLAVPDPSGDTADAALTLASAARTQLATEVGIGAVGRHLAVLTPTGEQTRSLPASLSEGVVRSLLGNGVLHLLRGALA